MALRLSHHLRSAPCCFLVSRKTSRFTHRGQSAIVVDLGADDWLPVAIQHSTGHYCRVAEKAVSGNWLISKRAMADLRSFVRMWARNLVAQGFATGKIVRAGVS